MWQTINLTNFVNPLLIDSQLVKFNLSAWLGGYDDQDDHVILSAAFTDQSGLVVGNSTRIGPVLASHRGDITSLVFRQTNSFVPLGARLLQVTVTLFHVNGTMNNGNVDDIAVVLYQ